MSSTLRELYDDLRVAQGHHELTRVSDSSEDPFIVKLAQLLLSYGVQSQASDIHIEPTSAGARVRYRIDGLLHEMLQLPQEIRDPLLRSLKLKANMAVDMVGRSKPQDSRIDFESNSRKLDLRLSSFPTLFGDVLAIRILDRSAPLLALEQVGFPPTMLKEFEHLIRRPNGLILATGPAGSGKTTTLYAALNKLRSPRIKIVTLEDPVEYQMEGIDQAQINPVIGLTFASGLRAILRQDANIILVGEIRDQETADIAIRAALTGHLVLSTMHTRNSLGAATRLIDMGIEPHLILSSVTGVMAQRLVRLLCPHCKAPDPVAAKVFAALWTKETGTPAPATSLASVYKGVGCTRCNTTGYHSRIGIFELLLLTDELKQLILDRASGQLYKSAAASGTLRTMLFNGLEKVAQGLTTIEEVLRVTGEAEDV
jgi:type II secretory ATPase GspE/PulE/Tfp pilus assembly ATPase PilB-like protein